MKTSCVLHWQCLAASELGPWVYVALTLRPSRPCTWSDWLMSATWPVMRRSIFRPRRLRSKRMVASLLAAGPGTVIEGSPPGTRFVILKWDSMEQLKGWREFTGIHGSAQGRRKVREVQCRCRQRCSVRPVAGFAQLSGRRRIIGLTLILVAVAFLSASFGATAQHEYVVKPVAEKKLKELPAGGWYWRIEKFPTLALAKAAGGPLHWPLKLAGRSGSSRSVQKAAPQLMEAMSLRSGRYPPSVRPNICCASIMPRDRRELRRLCIRIRAPKASMC